MDLTEQILMQDDSFTLLLRRFIREHSTLNSYTQSSKLTPITFQLLIFVWMVFFFLGSQMFRVQLWVSVKVQTCQQVR